MMFEIEAEKRFLAGEKSVLWLEEIDEGLQKSPKLVPYVESSFNVNWDWLIHNKYDDVVFKLKKKNGEVVELLVGSEITYDLELPQA